MDASHNYFVNVMIGILIEKRNIINPKQILDRPCIFCLKYWFDLNVDEVEIACHTSHTRRDDVIKWKHFPRYWPFVRGIHRWPVNSPHKGQGRGALMFSLIFARINGRVKTREAGDLRHHRTHYDVTVTTYVEQMLTGVQFMVLLHNNENTSTNNSTCVSYSLTKVWSYPTKQNELNPSTEIL